jgi:penicillin-binding protein 2
MERSTSRLKILAILVAFMFAALTTRLWFLQVLASASAQQQIKDQSVRIVQTDAVRGDILDDKGHVLVDNRLSLEVRVDQQHLGNDPEAELLNLSDVLGIPVKAIRARLADPRYFDYQPKPVAIDVSKDTAFYLSEHQDEFPGVEVVEASVRSYPEGTMAAHILGWVGQVSADELKSPKFKNYGPNDLDGKAGLEQTYEHYLRGKKGAEKFLVNSAGQNIRSLGQEPPTPGDNLVLSIDRDIQGIAEKALSDGIATARQYFDTSQSPNAYLKANAGAVIVMDPKTGEIKALASWPTFDPSWFVKGLSQKQSAFLFQNPAGPTLDRATQLAYAPGSTFKPFVALSAVQSGLASLGGYYACPATYTFPGDQSGTVFHNWSSTSLGSLSIAQALKVSCDTVFYGFGADFYNQYATNQFGPHALDLQKNLGQFGFGKDTHIDLPSESAGLIPTPDWKATFAKQNPQLFNQGEQGWLPGDDILMAIGQGYVEVSPLQLATAYAAIANGGKLCRPHLVDHIDSPQGHVVKRIQPRCRKLPYSQAEIDYIRNALATVTQSGGTAGYAFAGFPLSQIPVAGKTGTAQRPPFQDTSWFAAMVPAGDPQYVIVAMVEQGGHGSTTAAPIVRHVIEQLYGVQSNGTVNGGASD